MIELINVNKDYDNGVKAIDNLNLKIEQGEFAYLVGPSGAGKSTLIKLLYRQVKPTSGQIMVNNFNLNTITDKEIPTLRRTLGVVFQDFKLLPRLTVFENVAYALRVTETPEEQIPEMVNSVLRMVGLEERAAMFPNQISGGEQQRIAIARSIVNKPSVLIADEPTGNLDPNTTEDIMKLIEEINQSGTTILMATHNQDIVNTHVHRVIEIEHGVKIRDEEGGNYINENRNN
ncbi:cell-division associated ABC transporter, ATP binding FtsE subunit [Amylolactobacillus amylotrophicus DSM 20534]|uniref:Cell division ATP-binding protein FtsE n=3 Tax=Amylolactobacillus TaxID=2767876 RepID=A0A0R1YJ75_9LACO|nr:MULTISPECIES: cell division ATP-binding protein FtsE [Amylolactobacillus]APT18942.1 cell division ATP-binding protein FtsE [Amylolactobacillus amylophilus DSM 20533 = JCM 1125]KRK38799.1 cell-division associated ABC transporter, ATP binding FtsE subunit [Amylolactobacillus amylotrophicus DSM 20534]KRM42558.1 cell-division associated ABC transporter, ATP binding FtsE subunit [Amylolactobacillus amylophilus DSM 20533 = JCM 1125]GED80020.1 cell division ATP-binding protein FtsE [Amylolactobacil